MKEAYLDLLLDNGELLQIRYNIKHMDDLYDSLENAMKRRDWWSVNQFDGSQATYIGVLIERVNMARVVGML